MEHLTLSTPIRLTRALCAQDVASNTHRPCSQAPGHFAMGRLPSHAIPPELRHPAFPGSCDHGTAFASPIVIVASASARPVGGRLLPGRPPAEP